MINFKEYIRSKAINEDKYADSRVLNIYGEKLGLEIGQSKFNNLMEIKFSGERTLSKMKSAESLKTDDNEDDWNEIDKQWGSISKKYSKDIEKLVKSFERDLDKVLKTMSKDIDKLEF